MTLVASGDACSLPVVKAIVDRAWWWGRSCQCLQTPVLVRGLNGGRMVSFLGIRPILRRGERSSFVGGWVGHCVHLYALGVVVGLVVG